jgi:hypothetical protein
MTKTAPVDAYRCGFRLDRRFSRPHFVAVAGSRSHRWCWPARPDLGECWPSRLVATAAENRLSFRRNSHIMRLRPAIAEQSRFMSTRPSTTHDSRPLYLNE